MATLNDALRVLALCAIVTLSLAGPVAPLFAEASTAPTDVAEARELAELGTDIQALKGSNAPAQLSILNKIESMLIKFPSVPNPMRLELLHAASAIFDNPGPLPTSRAEAETSEPLRIGLALKIEALSVVARADGKEGRRLFDEMANGTNVLLRETAAELEAAASPDLSLDLRNLDPNSFSLAVSSLLDSGDPRLEISAIAGVIGSGKLVPPASLISISKKLRDAYRLERDPLVRREIVAFERGLATPSSDELQFLHDVATSPSENAEIRALAGNPPQ